MKIIFCLAATFAVMISAHACAQSPKAPEPIAVIELFTSQGCSSCPSADKLLAETLSENTSAKNVFALSFHVDYWNYIGWKDPFSDKSYSVRQRDYSRALELDNVYTPQMIVNGSSQFVGSDRASLKSALQDAFDTKPVVSFKTLTVHHDGRITSIKYELDGDFKDSEIHIALVSPTETTSIKRGENGGRTLVNRNVVRYFITEKAARSGEVEIPSLPANGDIKLIAYIQHKGNSKITGAATAQF